MIEVWFDGYLFAVTFDGDFLGRFPTQQEAFQCGYAAKCLLFGV